MAKGVRLQPIVSQKAAEKIKLVAEENGETISTIINRLIIMQLTAPQSVIAPTKTADLNRQLKDLRARLAPYNQKIEAGTITFAEKDAWYEIVEQITKTKTILGMETRNVDEIMREHYHREYQDLLDEYEYETIAFEAGTMTEEGEKIYHETAKRITTLKDRLK